MRLQALKEQRVLYAVHGRPSEEAVKHRVKWHAPGGVEAYRALAEQSANPTLVGELIARAWGTSLLASEHLERGWELGGHAQACAALDPRWKNTREWVEKWLNTGQHGSLYDERELTAWSMRRHRDTVSVHIAWGNPDYLTLDVPPRWDDLYQVILGGQWESRHGDTIVNALASHPGERMEKAALGLRRLGWPQWAQTQGVDLSCLPVPLLRSWGWVSQDAGWSGAKAALAERVWENFDESLTDLGESLETVLALGGQAGH